jgi:hypothetical protein
MLYTLNDNMCGNIQNRYMPRYDHGESGIWNMQGSSIKHIRKDTISAKQSSKGN